MHSLMQRKAAGAVISYLVVAIEYLGKGAPK